MLMPKKENPMNLLWMIYVVHQLLSLLREMIQYAREIPLHLIYMQLTTTDCHNSSTIRTLSYAKPRGASKSTSRA